MTGSSDDRRFGWTVGGAFAVLGVVLLWRHRTVAGAVLAALGGTLLLLAAAAPVLLAAPHRGWLAFAKVLGRVNSALFLFLTFFLVLTPLALFLRLLGRDELRRRGPAPASTWEPYPERNRDPKHYESIW
ncbi:MAG TPA: SxtJ family membrane protein [Thermoanaerobaculia bacterium]|nr:SxtJ family membrane protein [Thermoanaerobaculia bacterium]